MKIRDVNLLVHIINYCLEISDTIQAFGTEQTIFFNNKDYQKSILFTIFQIGELAKQFSKEFLAETKAEVPWNQIMKAKDRYVHGYLTIELSKVWETAIQDIPVLEAFCKEKLNGLQTPTDENPDPGSPRFRP
jgi:uncharacterized protein with HEPN domain